MLTQAEWQAKEKELEQLKAQRNEMKTQLKEISKKIHILSTSIRDHNSYKPHTYDYSNSIVYLMFGKRLKDLTADEHRIYYAARQRINRSKRKEKMQ